MRTNNKSTLFLILTLQINAFAVLFMDGGTFTFPQRFPNRKTPLSDPFTPHSKNLIFSSVQRSVDPHIS